MDKQTLIDIHFFLPNDRREAVAVDVAPCEPIEYVEAYLERYGSRDLDEAAKLAGCRLDLALAYVEVVQRENRAARRKGGAQ